MGRTDVEHIDEAVGREICARENLSGLVTAGIAKLGEPYTLTARLVDPDTGNSIRSYLERAPTEDGILEALGRLANQVRRDLGESILSVRRRSMRLPEVTTPSLEALESYARGQELWNKNQNAEAVEAWKHAIELDPGFAMAHATLGMAYASHVYRQKSQATEHFKLALANEERVTHREKLLMLAMRASSLGHAKESIERYQLYLHHYPDDPGARHSLGRQYMLHNQPAAAVEEFRTLISVLPSHAGAHINLATSLMFLGRQEEALVAYDAGFELEPTWRVWRNLNHEYGFFLVSLGRLDDAQAVFEEKLKHPDLAVKASAIRSLGLLNFYQGYLSDAAKQFQLAEELNDRAGWPISVARDRFLRALVRSAADDRAGMLADLDFAVKKTEEDESGDFPWLQCWIGVAYARAGEIDRALPLLVLAKERQDGESPKDVRMTLRLEGEIELSKGNAQESLALLQQAHLADPESRTVSSLFHAYRTLNDLDGAVKSGEDFMIHGLKAINNEVLWDWLCGHVQLARVYIQRGELPRARELIQQLLEIWVDADEGTPLLEEARALGIELSSG